MASRARQFREHWADELDGAAMYRALAERASISLSVLALFLAAAATVRIGRLIGVSVS